MSISPLAGSTLSMVSFHSGIDQCDDQLTTLMEDFVRATQLQISLKKRIDIVMKQRESTARAQEEKARMQWEDAQDKRQKLVEANRLLRLKMEQTESTGNTIREKDTEEGAGGEEPLGHGEGSELKAESTEPARTPLANESVAIPPTAANVDGKLQTAKPTIQIPTTPLHYSPRSISALIRTPEYEARSLDSFGPVEDELNDRTPCKQSPTGNDWFCDEDLQEEKPLQSAQGLEEPIKGKTPPPKSGYGFGISNPVVPPSKPVSISPFGGFQFNQTAPSPFTGFGWGSMFRTVGEAGELATSKIDTSPASSRPLEAMSDTPDELSIPVVTTKTISKGKKKGKKKEKKNAELVMDQAVDQAVDQSVEHYKTT